MKRQNIFYGRAAAPSNRAATPNRFGRRIPLPDFDHNRRFSTVSTPQLTVGIVGLISKLIQ